MNPKYKYAIATKETGKIVEKFRSKATAMQMFAKIQKLHTDRLEIIKLPLK